MRRTDVVVVGGGIMGCGIALRLAAAGRVVTVLERSVPGAEASTVAAGILAPRVEHEGGAAYALGERGLWLYPRFAEEIAERTGLSVGWRRSGVMQVALDADAAAILRTRAAVLARHGAPAELVDGDEARVREPALSPEVQVALDLPEEGQVEPPLLLRALALAAERAGARFRTGTPVREVVVENDRARGVRLADGSRVDGDVVIVAAGSWAGVVGGIGAPATAVHPVRGQLVHADTRRPLLSRIVFGAGGYVVPRLDGRVVCGATMEDAGFSGEVTLGGVTSVLTRAMRAVPVLEHARLVGSAVNFRPASRDDLPLIGPAGPDGLYLATGHFRNGILLAPATAELVADLVDHKAPALDPRPFDPRRFLA